MPLSGRYRAVIFDMDGLLLDTEKLWHEAEAELFARHGAEFTHEDQMRVIGTNFEVTARYFAERLGWPYERRAELVEESTALMHDRVRVQVDARPGAVELIEGLRKLDVFGLVSHRTLRATWSMTRWPPPASPRRSTPSSPPMTLSMPSRHRTSTGWRASASVLIPRTRWRSRTPRPESPPPRRPA